MKMPIVAVRDSAAGVFQHVQACQSKGGFIRSFADEVNRPAEDNLLYKHPADYEVFLIGEFDSETGRITVLDDIVSLGRAADYQATPGGLKAVN